MGLLEKASYYRMGFRDKAGYWLKKWGMVPSDVADTDLGQDKSDASGDVQYVLDKKIHDMNTLFEIGKELNSSLDIDELLQIILLTIIGQFGVNHLCLLLKKDKTFVLTAQRGLDDVDASKIKLDAGTDFIKKCEKEEKALLFSELFASGQEHDDGAVLTSLEAKVIAPLIAKAEINGLLVLGEKNSGEEYSSDEKDFLSMLSSMAAIAVSNATLYSNLKEANAELDKNFREFSTLYEISKIINSSDELDEVLKLSLETVSTGFGVDIASICLYNHKNELVINHSVGLSDETEAKFKINDDEPFIKIVIESGEPENIADFKDNKFLMSLFSEDDKEKLEHFFIVPLVSSEQNLGILIIHKINREENTLISDKDKKLFALIASQIAPPILSATLLDSGTSRVLDLYTPLAQKLEEEISLANDFGIPVTMIILKLQGASSYDAELQGMALITEVISKKLLEAQRLYRYGRAKLLVVMPNLTQDEAFSFIGEINKEARTPEISLNLEFSTVVFPDDGESASELLFKV